MLSHPSSSPSSTADNREARLQALVEQLRPDAERALRQMAQRLVDLPEDGCFGQLEYDLRDLAHQLAADAHRTGLQAAQKKATKAPVSSARTARTTPATSRIGRRPG